MSSRVIAHRYAQAVFDEAVSRNQEEVVERDLSTMKDIKTAVPELFRILKSPIIDTWRKKKIAHEVFKDHVSPLTLSFVTLILEKGRESFVLDIISQYDKLMDERRNIIRVEVTSAKPLDDDSKSHLEASLEKLTNMNVRAIYREDASLLGGLSVLIGDKVYDGSLRQQLRNLKLKLASE
jgi:F-type H+-transporting ATPase subunit delta